MLIDSHCHLDVEAFDHDRDDVLARAWAAGVTGILVPAIRPRTWSRVIALASRPAAARRMSMAAISAAVSADAADRVTMNGATEKAGESRVIVWIALGIHPQVVPELDADELSGDLAARIADAAVAVGAVAIGECGLDGATADHALQETILRAHIRAARETRLPLVLHVLRTHDIAPRILRDERAHEVGGIMHSYSGGAELVSVYRDLGMAFSFAGPITYENARRPVEAARAVPDELLLAETDAPDQSPAEHRGDRNEPSFLPSVIAGLATARDSTPEAIATLTTANARRLFTST
jgi:TatD DNase family protein